MFWPDGPIEAYPIWVEKNVSAAGDNAIRKEIRRIMDQCDVAFFLIGQDVHNSPWIEYEVMYALSTLRIPCFGIEHPKGSYGPPNLVPNLEMLPWNVNLIAEMVYEYFSEY